MIPHLCYFEGLNEIGACRVCVVEVEGQKYIINFSGNWKIDENQNILAVTSQLEDLLNTFNNDNGVTALAV